MWSDSQSGDPASQPASQPSEEVVKVVGGAVSPGQPGPVETRDCPTLHSRIPGEDLNTTAPHHTTTTSQSENVESKTVIQSHVSSDLGIIDII